MKRLPAEKRFLKKIQKTGSCWIYKGKKLKSGYGQFWFKRKNTLAHRTSWIIHKGDIPEGMCVCHSCDNPSCVNPNHLWLGTHKENTQDMIKKGRKKIQQKKIPEESRQVIIDLYLQGNTTRSLAKQFNVNLRTIGRILRTKIPAENQEGENNFKSILTEQEVIEMRKMYRPRKMGYHKISKKFGVAKSTAMKAIKGVTWKCLE
jgi:transposase-like protein